MKNIHETQPDPAKYQVPVEAKIIGIIEETQEFELGGPPKKVDPKALPGWLRLFFYFLTITGIIMALFGLTFTIID